MPVEFPNLADYPEIPQGCHLNYNRQHGLFQVYRTIRIRDEVTGKSRGGRETIGSISEKLLRMTRFSK